MLEKENDSGKKLNSFDTTDGSYKKFLDIPEEKKEKKNNKKKMLTLNCNNGRWTNEEHQLFLEAIFMFGNEWRKVQEHIKTRSSTQARSHAQKFFISIKKKLTNECEFSSLKKDSLNVQNDIEYEKISKLFKDCLPNTKITSLDKDKLVRFLMNMNNVQKKNRGKRDEKKNISAVKFFEEEENIDNKRKIFIIQKHGSKKPQQCISQSECDIQLSDISYKKRENFISDFLKLKRDLKEKKSPNVKNDAYKELNEIKSNTLSTKILNFKSELNPLTEHQNYLAPITKFDEIKFYFNSVSPRNMTTNALFNEIDIGDNKVLNDVDFLNNNNNDFERTKFNCHYTFDHENYDNYFNLNVQNSDNNEIYFNK
jgi:SHAQKYF class myb-like DNA-binding protein